MRGVVLVVCDAVAGTRLPGLNVAASPAAPLVRVGGCIPSGGVAGSVGGGRCARAGSLESPTAAAWDSPLGGWVLGSHRVTPSVVHDALTERGDPHAAELEGLIGAGVGTAGDGQEGVEGAVLLKPPLQQALMPVHGLPVEAVLLLALDGAHGLGSRCASNPASRSKEMAAASPERSTAGRWSAPGWALDLC